MKRTNLASAHRAGLTLTDVLMLITLDELDGAHYVDIADAFKHGGGVTYILDKLIDGGFVKRVHHVRDGRYAFYSLTAKGLKVVL